MRAFIIGGSGLVGRAVARRLLGSGWHVDVVGRDAANVPPDLTASFVAADRDDPAALAAAFGAGADLLVDCACFTGRQAEALVPLAAHATSTVLLSSKAVYVDAAGRHSNSDDAPDFGGPIGEDRPTLPPGDMPYDSPAGYGPNKVAAEQALLSSGLPVTVVRPSKIHGEGARPAREWVFVKRVLDRRPAVLLAHHGRGVDHPSAAVNIASLVETVATRPGARILNCADPDAPSGGEIARAVAAHFGHEWREVPLDDDADPALGNHPWDRPHPVVLDITAARELGWTPVGTYAETMPAAADWLAAIAVDSPAGVVLPPGFDGGGGTFDYAREDAFLRDAGYCE